MSEEGAYPNVRRCDDIIDSISSTYVGACSREARCCLLLASAMQTPDLPFPEPRFAHSQRSRAREGEKTSEFYCSIHSAPSTRASSSLHPLALRWPPFVARSAHLPPQYPLLLQVYWSPSRVS